ncbi:MAG: hypothetical protein PGN26_15535 [Xylophilus ampelinus]
MNDAAASNGWGRSNLGSALVGGGDEANTEQSKSRLARYSRTNLGWAAGLLDGEGCIRIDKRESRMHAAPAGQTVYSLEVTIAQPARINLERFRELIEVEGSLVASRSLDGQRWIYLLSYRDADAGQLLQTVEPYLVATKPQVKVAIDFLVQRSQWLRKASPSLDGEAVSQWHALCEVARLKLQSAKRVA